MTAKLLARPAALLLVALGLPARGQDILKDLQTAYATHATQKATRAYHFGSQGPGDVFSNHTTHSNRLIPVYAFGRKVDLASVTGKNSAYRDPERIKALYGTLPEHTLNPEAEYADQSDLYRVQRDAVARGAKYLFILWFDGMDWPTTQAAAIAKTGRVYTEGEGAGLLFQDYPAGGSAQFGWYVTSPTHDQNRPDLDAQTVTIPARSLGGGYDARIAGPNPWTLGPRGAEAPGYLKGQSADERDREGVAAVGGVLHAYTDSSTSAAAFISGRKAYNNGLNVTDDGRFVPTLFHELQAKGWKLGTVTSVPFNHASPAAMYAHNVHRDDYQDLARDMLGLPHVGHEAKRDERHAGLDVVIGTGWGQVTNEKSLKAQGKNGVAGALHVTDADVAAVDASRGGTYRIVHTTPGTAGGPSLLAAAESAAGKGERLLGLFGSKALNHLPYRTADGRYDPAPDLDGKAEHYTPAELKEQPTLADMTTAALTVLASKPGQPFALFVEAGDVDFALHKNNLDNAVGAVLSGEDALRVVIDWVEKHSNWDESVLIATADHGHYLVLDDPKGLAPAK
ncbi:MAG: alkaline phosphatase [Isosphaeraceae bacterium]|nr:alkaline phosphatase [Isosphaeraceae bacterium]